MCKNKNIKPKKTVIMKKSNFIFAAVLSASILSGVSCSSGVDADTLKRTQELVNKKEKALPISPCDSLLRFVTQMEDVESRIPAGPGEFKILPFSINNKESICNMRILVIGDIHTGIYSGEFSEEGSLALNKAIYYSKKQQLRADFVLEGYFIDKEPVPAFELRDAAFESYIIGIEDSLKRNAFFHSEYHQSNKWKEDEKIILAAVDKLYGNGSGKGFSLNLEDKVRLRELLYPSLETKKKLKDIVPKDVYERHLNYMNVIVKYYDDQILKAYSIAKEKNPNVSLVVVYAGFEHAFYLHYIHQVPNILAKGPDMGSAIMYLIKRRLMVD